jgi:hypothetical protein
MQNRLPTQFKRLFSHAEDWIKGCTLYEVALNILHNKASNITADRNTAKMKDDSYQAAKGVKAAAAANHNTVTEEARALVTLTREVLKPRLGKRWSLAWAELGFNNSLEVPVTSDDLLPMLESAKTYFAANVAYEVDQAGVTGSAASDKHDELSDARTAINACQADIGMKKAERDTALTALRARGRGLITELKQLMSGDDARWRAFGLNPPNAVGLPDVPEDVEVTPGMPGHLTVTFPSAALADRYHVFVKITGVDTDYVLKKTITETETDLNTFATGQVVSVRVSAVNDAGESLMSEPVEETVP